MQAIEERSCDSPKATREGADEVVSPPPIEKQKILRGQKNCPHKDIAEIIGLPCMCINAHARTHQSQL